MRSSSKSILIRLAFHKRLAQVIGPALLVCGTMLSSTAAQVGTPNPIDMIRNAQDYRLLSNLFPQAGPTFDPERDRVMSSTSLAAAAIFLSEQFSVQRRTFEQQSKSVHHALTILGVAPVHLTLADSTAIYLRDDQNAWSNTLSPTEVVIGARFLRGLVLGSLREAASGRASFSQSLASYLGNRPGITLSTADLELRARLFFAAARNGVSLIRTEEDFREHFKNASALLDSYLGGQNTAALHDALEQRLKAAAAGGQISGADGMAMFDVFMRLSSHFDPASLFAMSHELGHVVLGHAPFPPELSCAEKQRREDDADAFAIALLVYDVPGDLEVTGLALAKTTGSKNTNSAEDNRLAYGYTHAIRYGFALAGLSNQIDATCSYRDAENRIAFIDAMRAKLIAIRAAAVEQVFRAFKQRPPYVYVTEDVDSLSAKARRALARSQFQRCRAKQAKSAPTLRKLDDLPFGWVVPCPNRFPPQFATDDFRLTLGSWTSAQVAQDYERHVPVSGLFDDAVLKALQSE
jgi:hypothetical protein